MKLLNFTRPPNLLSSHQTAEFAEFIRTPNLSSSSDRRFHITMTVNGKTALMYAAMNGHTDTVNALAGTHGANVDAVDNGDQTALMYAAWQGHTDIVNLLAGTRDAHVVVVSRDGRRTMMVVDGDGSTICVNDLSQVDTVHALQGL